jgi:hypothetical protein
MGNGSRSRQSCPLTGWAFGTLATTMGGTKAMKCKCPSETHGHEAGKCNNLATEPDHMCKPCHDKVAKEMHVAHPTDNQTPINQPRR